MKGFRHDSRGVAQDDILVNQEWGFDLESVKPRIDIWHGEADVNGAGRLTLTFGPPTGKRNAIADGI
jgi:hypothetical protein